MPTLTPPDSGSGCSAWVYVLHWDRPSRLAALKNALGDSVSIVSEYYPPGTKVTDNTTSPWVVERVPDARFAKPDLPSGSPSPHSGAAVGGAADGSDWGSPTNGNWLAAGVTVSYKQGAALEAYLSSLPPRQPTPTPASPTATPTPATGIDLTADSTIANPLYDYPWGGNVVGIYHLLPYDQFGNQATWTWTLTYGKDKDLNQIYGDDPGPPFVAYDETRFTGYTGTPPQDPAAQPYLPRPQPPDPYASGPGSGSLEWGSSIPGVTGWPVGNAAALMRVEAPKKIVSDTADKVNWGLFSFQDRTPYSIDPGTYCSDPGDIAKNYELIQHVYPDDKGKIASVEGALRLVYYGGIYTAGGTPSKEGLRRAGADMETFTFATDPKIPIRCDRPYGLIFCTDGLSNICNPAGDPADFTGPPALPAPPGPKSWAAASGGEPWTSPCEGYYGTDAGCYTAAVPPGGGAARLWRCCDPGSKRKGSGYDCETNTMLDPGGAGASQIDTYKTAKGVPPSASAAGTPDGFVAGIAETLFTNGFVWTDPSDGSKVTTRVRTFVIGLSPTVGKCELNYTAYRGRTDASAPKGDAGYTYQIIPPVVVGDPPVDPGDPRLPQDQNGEDGTTPNTYAASVPSGDYAFFANDAKSIYDAFQEIIAGTATGDYATSPPIAGASVAQGNIVLLPSTEYPKWRGRLRAVDTLKPTGSNTKWDAGEILSNPKDANYQSPANRKIFTWDPANIAGGLIEVLADNGTRDTLAAIAGLATTKFTTNVLDFIRGNDGTLTNTARSWVFGASINSTPAVIGKPEIYTGNFAGTHSAYEIKHKNRSPVAWVGADDGMLHAFDFNTGTEILALLPPELLARQVTLFQNFQTLVHPITKERRSPTGQDPDIRQHIWGVAQSFRYADVYDTANSAWKTIGYLTLGPAGKSVTAIDVSHPSFGDAEYDASKLVELLWRKSDTDLPGLDYTWSVPAVAANQASPEKFLMLMGAGYDPASVAGSQKPAKLFQLQALDGADGYLTGNKNFVPIDVAALDASNKPLVGQEAFSASVFFDTTMPTYYGNNIADLGLQADLNGRIWFNYPTGGTVDFDQVKIGIDVPKEIGNIEGVADQAPLYYPPAASGVGKTGCQVYSFGSGTAYEKSPLVTNPSGEMAPAGEKADYSWKPRLFVAVNKNKAAAQFGTVTVGGPGEAIYSVPVSDIELPPCDPKDPGPRCRLGSGDPTTFGPRTQMTAPPFLLVPLSGTGSFQALFLLYDPDAIGYCRGYSYIVVMSFSLTSCEVVTVDKTDVYQAGEGAASGFAMAGTKIVVGKSGVGSGQKAGVFETPINILNYGGFGNVTPVYWKELQ